MVVRKPFEGMLKVHLTSANISETMSAIAQAGFSVLNWDVIDELNAVFTVSKKDFKKIERILRQKGDQIEILGKTGIYWRIIHLFRRPVLLVGILILLLLNAYIPSRVLFIKVEGNSNIPTRKILEEAQKCGLSFGAERSEIRSERVKNALLESIPELQWSGVNTKGCVAVISVRERESIKEHPTQNVVSSIVAIRDGVIEKCTVTRGSALCKIGQAVKAGEILISGYTDCGITIQATRAEGEVYAKTERAVSVISPLEWLQNRSTGVSKTKYSLIIGKKRINLYNDSGISYPTCGKMYKEMYITLPGGFNLPVCIVEETWDDCVSTNIHMDADLLGTDLLNAAESYVIEQMVAGKVLNSSTVITTQESVAEMEGKYACLEMIGQVRKEEVYGKYE